MSFTVVVPFHGPVSLIEPLLRALDDQQAEVVPTVLVSDDASSEPVEPGIAALGLRRLDVQVVRSEVNGGPGAARNRVLDKVETEWVAFLDGDVVPETDWVSRMTAMIERTTCDVVEGVARMPSGGEVTPFTHATETAPPDRHGAGNVAMRVDLLRSIGGFDERYFDTERKIHFREDADLTFRLQSAGATYDFDPDLVVWHPPLEPSFWTPVRLARRYYFDPLLARDHPAEYADMHSIRRVGPVSLRGARHHACTGFVTSIALLGVGVLTGLRPLRRLGLVLLAIAWPANVIALCWKRTVRIVQLPAVLAAAALTPFSYVYHYLRGVRDFGHRPRH